MFKGVMFHLMALLMMPISSSLASEPQKITGAEVYSAPEFFEKAASLDYEKMSISLEKFLELHGQDGVVVIDLRSAASFDKGHVDGAVHLSAADITKADIEKIVPDTGTQIVLYCDYSLMPMRMIPLTHMSAPQFVALGYENVLMLDSITMHSDIKDYKTALPWVGE